MAIDFAALIASRKSGFTLPAPFYLDPEVYARAMASTGPAFEAIEAVGETGFLEAAVELARDKVRDGLPIRARVAVVGYDLCPQVSISQIVTGPRRLLMPASMLARKRPSGLKERLRPPPFSVRIGFPVRASQRMICGPNLFSRKFI